MSRLRIALLLAALLSLVPGQARAQASGFSAECRSLLGPDTAVADFLDDPLAICPHRDGASREVACPSGLKVAEELAPGFGQMADVNKIPNFEIEDIFLDARSYDACEDIFQEEGFRAPLKRIPPATSEVLRSKKHWSSYDTTALDPVQLSMARVLASIENWSYCHRIYEEGPFVVHAEYRRKTGTILLYRTSCLTKRIYGEEIGDLGAGHRFHLVAGHEVGHAIDAATGDADTDSDPARAEIRATIYGTYIARCLSRQFQGIVRENLRNAQSPLQTRQGECLIERWQAVDARLKEIATRGPTVGPDSLARIQGALGCVSLADDR